jgi:hypothetical protein
VPEVHKYIGFLIVGLFTIGWVWGLGARLLRRGPGDWFWRWLTVVQIVAVVQGLAGITLLILGYRPDQWLHLVYGFGPLVVIVIAHDAARREEYRARPWVPFAWAAFFCFGLTLRALMTGLGTG